MFDSRIKKFLSVVLSSCTLGCISSFLACNADTEVSENDGELVTWLTDDASNPLTQNNFGEIVVDVHDKNNYVLRGNAIHFGENSHLISYDTVPPMCDLYIRAVKIKDEKGDKIEYNPNTSDTTLDTMWILYEGRATLDWLALSPGVWKTYAVRYTEGSTANDYDVERVILDKSCSTDGINRYTLVDKDGNVVSPDVTFQES